MAGKDDTVAMVVREMLRLVNRQRKARPGKPWPVLQQRLRRLEDYLRATNRRHDPDALRP